MGLNVIKIILFLHKFYKGNSNIVQKDWRKDLGFVYNAKVSNFALIWNGFSTEYIYKRGFENEKVKKPRRNNHIAIFYITYF